MSEPQLLRYDLGADVLAFSTTRHGGCGSGNYGGFNINRHCGDDIMSVEKNAALLCDTIGIDAAHLAMPRQVHGTEVRVVDETFAALPAAAREQTLDGVDAVMTCASGLCVGVSTADCVPILLYDAAHHACCAVHAGWRGTVAMIAAKAVRAMTAAYATQPRDLRACIGPSISLERFEVGDEVWQAFASAGFDMKRISRRYDKWHVDLWECNRLQLAEAGLAHANIHVAGVCTYSHADDFFSARRLGSACGRIFSGIMTGRVTDWKLTRENGTKETYHGGHCGGHNDIGIFRQFYADGAKANKRSHAGTV